MGNLKRGMNSVVIVAFLVSVTLGICRQTSAQKTLTVRGWDYRATKDISPQVREFEMLFPDVKIKQINIAPSDHHTKLMMEIISGTGAPDVAYETDLQARKFRDLGGLIPVTDVLPNWEELFVPQSLVEWRWAKNGILWGFPAYVGPFGIFYRKDMFDEAGVSFPTSWEEFIEIGKKITVPEKRYMTCFLNSGSLPAALAQGRGGEVSDIDNVVRFNNPIMREVLQYIADGVLKHKIAEYAPYWTPEGFQKVKEGRWATIPTWHWYQTFGLKDQAYTPELVGKWRWANCLPWKTGDPPTGASFLGGDGGWMVLKQTKYPEIAKKFGAFLVTGDATANIAMRRGLFPYNINALEVLRTLPDPFFGGQCHYGTGLEELQVMPPMKYGTKSEIIIAALTLVLDKVIEEGAAVEEALSESEDWARKEMRE